MVTIVVVGIALIVEGAGIVAGSLFASDKATLTILYTNDTRGYLEPCGCRPSALGGLPRRAMLVKRIREGKGRVVLLDSGNLTENEDKLGVVLQAMAMLNYDAIGLGPLDWALDGQQLSLGISSWKLPVIVSVPPTATGRDHLAPWRAISVGPYRIGIAATLPVPGLKEEDLWVRLEPTLEHLRRANDVVVLLSQLGLAADRRVAQRQARGSQGGTCFVDLIIGNAEARALQHPELINSTWILPTSMSGQHVGEVNLRIAEGRVVVDSHRLIPVDESLPPDPNIAQLVGYYYACQERLLRDANWPSSPENHKLLDPLSTVSSAYVTAERCAECHRKEYTIWTQHQHARAVETLRQRSRLVPECLECHSEMYRRMRMFDKTELRRLSGVECSACHGEGTLHALLERKEQIVSHPDETLCRTCHNAERDADFNWGKDLQLVKHWSNQKMERR